MHIELEKANNVVIHFNNDYYLIIELIFNGDELTNLYNKDIKWYSFKRI